MKLLGVTLGSVQWSYAIFCSMFHAQRGVLECLDGYYSWDIKTRVCFDGFEPSISASAHVRFKFEFVRYGVLVSMSFRPSFMEVMDSVRAHEPKKRRLPPWIMGAATSNQVREENKDDRVGSINHAALDSEITLPEVQKRSQKIVKKCSDEDKEMRVSEEVCAPKLKTRSRKFVNKNLDEDEDAHGSEEVCSPKLKRRSKRIQKGPLHEDEEANADDSCILVKCASIKRKRKNISDNASDVHSIGNEKFTQISASQKKKKGNVNKLTPNEATSSCTDRGRELLMEDLIGIAQECER
ncbi:hypothetical protein QQ045_024526 [Rhodiola kirilowii]